jgi:hypothetical protein
MEIMMLNQRKGNLEQYINVVIWNHQGKMRFVEVESKDKGL